MKKCIHFNRSVSNLEIIDESKLIRQYYILYPDVYNKEHNVVFGTSGHRGSSKRYNFNEAHILAISQSIVQIRKKYGITGPCYVGKDTHILSEPAFISVLEVLTANFIHVIIQSNNGYTPTPVISHAIVHHNLHQYYNLSQADGIIITSSHNPPEDGGIKYNFIFGGPASFQITKQIEQKANYFLKNNLRNINRITLNRAINSGYIHTHDFIQSYIKNLSKIVNIQAIRRSGLKLGVHPLSGSSIDYWQNIAQYHQLNLNVVNDKIDSTFSFMSRDNDGHIRIDCSSERNLIKILKLSKNFDLFFINDPDSDRHGIITNFHLIKSNYYFAIVLNYLFNNRKLWKNCALFIGKTCVSSILIDKVSYYLNQKLLQVPIGFKWFTKGLFNGAIGFASEDSAGASFLDQNCMPWSTDKDGLIMCLLAAEIIAVTNQNLNEHCNQISHNFGISYYNRIQIIIDSTQKQYIENILFNQMNIIELAGDPIIKVENIIPFNHTISMSGVKIITCNGWIACRLSGTELIYKIYCESFLDVTHRQKMEHEIITNIYKMVI